MSSSSGSRGVVGHFRFWRRDQRWIGRSLLLGVTRFGDVEFGGLWFRVREREQMLEMEDAMREMKGARWEIACMLERFG